MKRQINYTFFITTTLLFFALGISAQEEKRISGDFQNMAFKEFVQKIEETTVYQFYYNPAELDSLRVNLRSNEQPLSQMLKEIFSGTEFLYAIDSFKNVFISKRFAVQTSLPPNFFDRTNTAMDTGFLSQSVVYDVSAKKKSTVLPTENKLFVIGVKNESSKTSKATITGYVRDVKNGEGVANASVSADSSSLTVSTDQFGYYSISLTPGQHTLYISAVGMKESRRQVLLYSDGTLNIDLEDRIMSLKAVVVHADRNSNITNTLTGVNRLSMRTIKQMPALLGETDILRSILMLPGVVSVGEGSTGFNVRGGSADQNLILFNDATIYNPSHLFGFFTAFNPDVVKGVELYKSGIPEKYGGRLSSVLDVTAKEGNNKELQGVAGIGLLTSKLTLEGPLVKDKTSFMIGGRTTYSNWLLKKVPNASYSNSEASFYDVSLHVNHSFSPKDNLILTMYRSNDQFRLNNDTLYQYGNNNANIKWKHIFNSRLYALLTLGLDDYHYTISGNEEKITGYEMKFNIGQKTMRTDFHYAPGNKHKISFGANAIYYELSPGAYKPKGIHSLVIPDVLSSEQALETALYIGDRYSITEKLSVNAGVRFSHYSYLGPKNIYNYVPGAPKDPNTIKDTSSFGAGKVIQTYYAPEYRLSAAYVLNDSSSLKLSYNSLRQYIHMISNTTAISPTDVWKLSDPHIKPQEGHQFSLGFYKNFKGNSIESSIEVYYKKLKNYLDYKSGARLTLNHHLETDVISTKGKAYGVELLLRKPSGRLNGWISYSYSRTWLKMNDSLAGEVINGGRYYPANFDKPHNLNVIGNYRFSHRFSISMNGIYNTGRPITLPVAIFNTGGVQGIYYSDRNQYRIPDYYRIDLSVNVEGNHKLKQKTHNSWTIGVYNLLGRDNPYSVYFTQENGKIKGYQLSIFASQIPFITYNIRF